jgi:hypothetical protein
VALARWTDGSMGGPTYVEDPRVQEAVALGELLLRSRAAAQTQSDRLFERKQALNDFDERRRQFNEEQQRLADAAKMSAADQERRLGLEQQRLAADAEQFGQRLAADTAGAAEDRLFRRDDAAARDRNRVADNERADRQFSEAQIAREREGMDERYMRVDEARKAREFSQEQEIRAHHAQAERDAGLANQREKEIQSAEIRDARRADAARRQQKEEIEAERVAAETRATAAETKAFGNEKEQRAQAVTARKSRFRMALEAEIGDGKNGRLSDADQAKAVQRAYRAATEPDLDPQRITREKQLIGPEEEAAFQTEVWKIVQELLPGKQRREIAPLTGSPMNLLGLPTAEALKYAALTAGSAVLPDWYTDAVNEALGKPTRFRPSGAMVETEKLFRRPSEKERRTSGR